MSMKHRRSKYESIQPNHRLDRQEVRAHRPRDADAEGLHRFEWTEDFFSATLRNADGGKMSVSGMDTDLRRLIVGMEIVDVRRVST